MKYGLIDFNKTVNWYWQNSWNNKALLNIGDASEYLVVEQIYNDLGISECDIVRLCIDDLIQYRGEKLIVALNIALDSYVGYNNLLEKLSPDITPVFLGMSFTDTNLKQCHVDCLKRYQPVGCRDERSYELLVSKGIDCYLSGCTVGCINLERFETNQENTDRILFIDVPVKVAEYVPEEIKSNVVFLNQEIYCRKNQLDDKKPSDWAEEILKEYALGAKLIVTSRFHGAVLALSQDIPVIVTLEKYTFRFSWLNNYCQICTEENYNDINWNVKKVDFTKTNDLIKKVAIERLNEVIKKNKNLLELTDMQRYSAITPVNSSNQVLYYYDVLNEIQNKWSKDECISFAFWGVNDNADHLYEFIKKEYPNAKLIAVYDMYKSIEYNGICSEHPDLIKKHMGKENFYIIVTAYLAARVATDICENIGFPMENFLLCERKFINKF